MAINRCGSETRLMNFGIAVLLGGVVSWVSGFMIGWASRGILVRKYKAKKKLEDRYQTDDKQHWLH